MVMQGVNLPYTLAQFAVCAHEGEAMSHSTRSFGQFMLDQLTKTGLILIACLASFAWGVFAGMHVAGRICAPGRGR